MMYNVFGGTLNLTQRVLLFIGHKYYGVLFCVVDIQLLRYNPSERLGGGPGGSDDVRSHPFFSGIEWNNLLG